MPDGIRPACGGYAFGIRIAGGGLFADRDVRIARLYRKYAAAPAIRGGGVKLLDN